MTNTNTAAHENLATSDLRKMAVYMAQEYPIEGDITRRDPLADSWIIGRISDNDYANSSTDTTFQSRRILALMIARCAHDQNGQAIGTEREVQCIHVTMQGSQSVEDLIDDIGPWNGKSQGIGLPRLPLDA